jgi:hypothetical protein
MDFKDETALKLRYIEL